MPRSGPRILLLGGDADHNVGDRAIVSALSQCIVSHDPSAEVAIVASHGAGPRIRGVASMIPRGAPGFAGLCRIAVTADRILIAGGGLFQDDDSRAKMPYWAARIALLKSLNPRIAGHSIGAGPLRHVESRAAAGVACAALTTISVRDRFAQQALAACTPRSIDVVPDPAFMLDAAPSGDAIDLLRSLDLLPGRPLIAVAARHWFHSRGGFVPNVLKAKAGIGISRDKRRFELLLDVLVDGLTHLARRLEAAVLLLPSYNVAHEGDDVVCEALARRLRDVTVRMARITDPPLYKAVLGRASLIISSRMHPLILGAGMGVPLVGLSYNDKFQGLFDQLGMASRLLRLDEFPGQWGSGELIAAAEAALEGRDDLRHRAELLGAVVHRRTLEVAFADLPERMPEAADA
jgi:polysaccharide pyruvyl transferase WcaK-like protein